jgi:hypothetical protein
MVSVAIWLLGYAFELANTELTPMLWGTKVGYLGVATAPTLWLVFAIQYTGKERWLTRRNLLALFTMPSLIILLVWTNSGITCTTRNTGLIPPARFPCWRTRAEQPTGAEPCMPTWCSSAPRFCWCGHGYAREQYLSQTNQVHSERAIFSWAANFLYLTGLNPSPISISPH